MLPLTGRRLPYPTHALDGRKLAAHEECPYIHLRYLRGRLCLHGTPESISGRLVPLTNQPPI
jgi:hypothetical protein